MAFYILKQKRIVNICNDVNKTETRLLPILCVCDTKRLPLTLPTPGLVHVQISNNDDIAIIILVINYLVWIEEKKGKKDKLVFFCRLKVGNFNDI
jgi:hypothetical protein